MKKYFCDCCGEEIKGGVYVFNPLVHIKDVAEGNFVHGYVCGDEPVSGKEEKYDLCLSCYNKIYLGAYKIFAGKTKGKEIERKFLISIENIPKSVCDLKNSSYSNIEQTYLQTEETEIRIRKILREVGDIIKTECFLTVKDGEGRIRDEFEKPIFIVTYDLMFKGIPIKKKRIGIKYGEHLIELDLYDNIDLIVAEVEFPTEKAANEFIVPSWFGEEVTDNKEYKNKNLWKKLQKTV